MRCRRDGAADGTLAGRRRRETGASGVREAQCVCHIVTCYPVLGAAPYRWLSGTWAGRPPPPPPVPGRSPRSCKAAHGATSGRRIPNEAKAGATCLTMQAREGGATVPRAESRKRSFARHNASLPDRRCVQGACGTPPLTRRRTPPLPFRGDLSAVDELGGRGHGAEVAHRKK